MLAKSPGLALRQWIAHFAPTLLVSLGDTFMWRSVDTGPSWTLEGLLRIRSSAVDSILALSGQVDDASLRRFCALAFPLVQYNGFLAE